MQKPTVSLCKNKQKQLKQWDKFAMAHMWRPVYLCPSGCIELLWFVPCSSKPHRGEAWSPVSGPGWTPTRWRDWNNVANLAHFAFMFHLQRTKNTAAPGKTQTILRQSRANCHPTLFCGYVESDKCCSPPWQLLGHATVKWLLDVQLLFFFLGVRAGDVVCVASCFLGNGLSLAVGLLVSLSKHVNFFWSRDSILGIACLSPQHLA